MATVSTSYDGRTIALRVQASRTCSITAGGREREGGRKRMRGRKGEREGEKGRDRGRVKERKKEERGRIREGNT